MGAFSLIPHPDSPSPDITISAEAARTAESTFIIRYVLSGSVGDILVPEPVRYASRYAGLWNQTCFEAFVAPSDISGYLEFNFSPSTAWNAFRFATYRIPDEIFRFPAPHFDVERPAGRLEVTVALDTTETPEMIANASWYLNLSAVIEEVDGTKSYWALAHAPGPPDFHNRDCFIATLPAPERA